MTRSMRRETYNGRALALAQLACCAAYIVALGRWANDDRPAGWGFEVFILRAGQNDDDRAGVLIGQIIGVV